MKDEVDEDLESFDPNLGQILQRVVIRTLIGAAIYLLLFASWWLAFGALIIFSATVIVGLVTTSIVLFIQGAALSIAVARIRRGFSMQKLKAFDSTELEKNVVGLAKLNSLLIASEIYGICLIVFLSVSLYRY